MRRYGCVTALVGPLAVLLLTIWTPSCSSDDDVSFNPSGSGGSNTGGGSTAQGGGGANNNDELTLVSRIPAPNAANVWSHAPIELEFSQALDEATVESSVRLVAAGKDLSRSIELSSDGKSVVIRTEATPALPEKLQLVVSSDLSSTSGKKFVGESWSWSLPLWQKPEGSLPNEAGNTSGLALGVDGERRVLAVLPHATGNLIAVRHEPGDTNTGSWSELAAPPVVDGPATPVAGVVDASGRFVVLWVEGTSSQTAYVARLENDEWTLLGDAPVVTGSDLRPALALDGDDPLVAARASTGAFTVRGFDGDAWSAVGSNYSVPGGTLRELALTTNASGVPVVAAVDAAGDVRVASQNAATWSDLGVIDRVRASNAGSAEPQIAWSGGAPVVAYVDGDEVSTNVQVAARVNGDWVPQGAALDIEIDANASAPRLLVAADGGRVVMWREQFGSQARLLAARWMGSADSASGWRVLGSAVSGAMPGDGSLPTLALDADGNVHGAWLAAPGADGFEVRRFNGSPSLPYGLAAARDRGDCDIPADGAGFPQTLSATGCYEDLAARKLVSAAIPFSINSMLWSDGAFKRRYVLLPENGTVDYVSQGALGMPVGTIIIKEFYVAKTKGDPSTLTPVETRFLVKRLADDDNVLSWQGYSYQWNSVGTEGTLLPGDAPSTKDWPVKDGGADVMHTHSYPSRAQCTECHNAPTGRVLGLQASQLNRAQDYAGGIIDNQLRAWIEAGLFGDTAPTEEPETLGRLPSPPDVGRTPEERARSYFHSNCAHCHRGADSAGGAPVTIDFRYFTPLAADNVCNFIVKGNHAASRIWQNDSLRGVDNTADGITQVQMPPIATLVPDSRQLSVTAAWIDSASSCP